MADIPALVQQWHPIKNVDLDPATVSLGSGRKVWWKCPAGADHEWQAFVSNRSKGVGCPFCAGKRASAETALARVAPALAAQWHPKLNRALTAWDVVPGSNRKVWWLCPASPEHEWEAVIAKRSRRPAMCPFCSGRRIPGEPPRPPRTAPPRTVADFPELARQWDQRRNAKLRPEQVLAGSGKKVWWRCDGAPDHRWPAMVSNRTKGIGCPFCSGKRVSARTSLSHVAPAISRQWHPDRNGELTPRDVTAGSNKTVWWRCKKAADHEWQAAVHKRVSSGGTCPFCTGKRVSVDSSLAAELPLVAREWHPFRNGDLRPEHVRPGSAKQVWWQCSRNDEHVWRAAVCSRAARNKPSGCPYCSTRLLAPERSLAALSPTLARQWHPTKNGDLDPREVFWSSGRRVWWKCPKGPDHEWQVSPNSRVRASGRKPAGCPFCRGLRVSVTNSLAARFPELAVQWHPAKNGGLRPEGVSYGSGRIVWWKCPKGPDHEWQSLVAGRTRPDGESVGCPFCLNKRVSITNSLPARYPKIARQWHTARNGALRPEQFVATSDTKVWWLCPQGHEWYTRITIRTKGGSTCPHCKLRKRKRAMTYKAPRTRVYLPSDLS